ncbi:MAG TPA: hypothetical protein VFK05_20920 [Polyangiaceae bacterium]|nr:hypothetical protein [Polyangiaceae bacterium]
MNARIRHGLLLCLSWGGFFSACGGHAERDNAAPNSRAGTAGVATQHGGANEGGTFSGAGEPSAAGNAGKAAAPNHGGATTGGATTGGAAAGTGEAGAEHAGEAGAIVEPPPVALPLGDYDAFLAKPPEVAGCSVAWYEPRINLTLSRNTRGSLEAVAYADFFWQANAGKEPTFGSDTLQLYVLADSPQITLTPVLELGWDARGFHGPPSAEIPYTCQSGARTTRTVPVTLEVDRTSPKLRVDPVGFLQFGYTPFGFTFSEPVALPSGDFGATFSDPSDGNVALELYDLDTKAALPTSWKWSLAGPVAQARFLDPAAVEGRTIATRLLAPLADRAGNPLLASEQTFAIARSAVLETALDFDQEPAAGIYGNASYHVVAGAGAACEQGGCLVLDGPVVSCYGAPRSTFAVRLSSAWDESIKIRYRVWSSTASVSPLAIGYASGCTGSVSLTLTALAQPDGAFTHASDWRTISVAPCGGPDYENGFSLSLDCAESEPPPAVRVIVERIERSGSP